MFAATYYGLLRISEVASGGPHPIKAVDVHIGMNKRKFLFILRTSKTHWTDVKPQRVAISSTNKWKSPDHCLYKILREFLAVRPPYCTNSSEPFFVFSNRSPVTTEQVRRY